MAGLTPVTLDAGKYATQLSLGDLHTCALLNDGGVRCWGSNANGQLGLNSTVSYGNGTNNLGTCTTGCSMTALLTKTAISLGTTATVVRAGYGMSCAVLTGGTIKCWGLNSRGQSGVNNINNYGSSPTLSMAALPSVNTTIGAGITPALNFTDVTISNYTARGGGVCGITSDNRIKCWGDNTTYQAGIAAGTQNVRITQIGNATSTSTTNATMVSTLTGNRAYGNLTNIGTGLTINEIVGGSGHYCARINNGADVKCWGLNNSGQLGLENTTAMGKIASELGNSLLVLVFGGTR
jgi:alpha-tubulin suppressor-like RCC1 family protein